MKSWTHPPLNGQGNAITTSGPHRQAEVITAASTRSSSKLATHTRAPTNPARK